MEQAFVSALKSCLIQKYFFKLGNILGGLKIVFFRASCFGYSSKGCLSATPSFSLPAATCTYFVAFAPFPVGNLQMALEFIKNFIRNCDGKAAGSA